jgi:hypothetical protein
MKSANGTNHPARRHQLPMVRHLVGIRGGGTAPPRGRYRAFRLLRRPTEVSNSPIALPGSVYESGACDALQTTLTGRSHSTLRLTGSGWSTFIPAPASFTSGTREIDRDPHLAGLRRQNVLATGARNLAGTRSVPIHSQPPGVTVATRRTEGQAATHERRTRRVDDPPHAPIKFLALNVRTPA